MAVVFLTILMFQILLLAYKEITPPQALGPEVNPCPLALMLAEV